MIYEDSEDFSMRFYKRCIDYFSVALEIYL